MANYKEKLKNIKAFIFDVDGVFTDGKIYLEPGGEFVRAVDMKDGYAVNYAIKQGYIIGIISGGNSEAVRKRFQFLKITDIYMNSKDKKSDFEDFYFKYNLKPEEILYMGDDIPDYEVMKLAGLSTCPADAVEEIKSIAHYISTFPGGQGCVRDVIEQVLKLQGKWVKY
ncbi:MAG: 3-deoxy-D-manno-octulosonate 8-phosphate phosphatase [Bacteroidetes bacterium GWC2_33_15]|nr:MAG: 3-deoxy-D-manno-octulosonate 8-phosphate phosphatase [Bacteroidetes bacterium GWA2_33_15]OFX50317.1 MAG: 3-deoxy-D-manno-octulosonate 8-phosphate phosphatase [Bacteroidetes bacterium GWC2_33_15]OFX66766.1 MAG: 3-deoxy-D-manno-octulosonate 8-phosphate phosphatase [Bacteroidetes bacterium GWB2_32_14]OFX69384.1 MAG: 3-deoxy-D-manno-octulosonate 8-phosphate phosphatase [Bacteroidetes bacterium GWD2_33_33]HAN18706.1 3-deoxy-D-manno-octulosonate 8-phosphate phosphatase [Bacteroidales bacteriu